MLFLYYSAVQDKMAGHQGVRLPNGEAVLVTAIRETEYTYFDDEVFIGEFDKSKLKMLTSVTRMINGVTGAPRWEGARFERRPLFRERQMYVEDRRHFKLTRMAVPSATLAYEGYTYHKLSYLSSHDSVVDLGTSVNENNPVVKHFVPLPCSACSQYTEQRGCTLKVGSYCYHYGAILRLNQVPQNVLKLLDVPSDYTE